MRYSSKVLATALSAAMLMSACSSGSSSSTAASTAGTTNTNSSPASSAVSETPKELVEITSWVWDRGSIPTDQGTLEDNWWTQYTDEAMAQKGIKVNYVITPRAQEAEMLSTMLAAGTAPDVLHTGQAALVNTYINGGGVADLTEAVEKYGQNLTNLYNEETLKWGTKNGSIYGFYHLNNGFLATTWIRKDMLDELGMDVPTTPTEYRDLLVAAKETYGAEGISATAFQGDSFTHVNEVLWPAFVKEEITELDLWKPIMLIDGYKDCLKYVNELYNEGLVREFILDSDESLFRQAISTGELFSFVGFGHYPYHSAYGNLYDNLRQNDADAELIATYPWVNESLGINYYSEPRGANPMTNYFFFVPATSKHVDEAVQYLDWLASDEVYNAAVIGFEGVDYEWVDGVPTVTDNEHYLATVPWIEPQYGTLGKAFTNDPEKFKANYMKDFNPAYYEGITANAKVFQDIGVICPTLTEAKDVYDDKRATLSDIEKTARVQLIMCKPEEFDALWDSFMSEYLAAGAEEAWADLQDCWAKMGN